MLHLSAQLPVADLGFSPGGAPTPKVGVLIYYFCRKLHENERIWTPRGGARPWRPPWIRQWLLPKICPFPLVRMSLYFCSVLNLQKRKCHGYCLVAARRRSYNFEIFNFISLLSYLLFSTLHV